MTRKQGWLVAFVAIAAIAASAYYARFVREITVATAPLETNVEARVFGIGTIEAQILSKIGFQIVGKIDAIEADQGDLVKAGALLARLDGDAQRAKLMKSEAAQRQAAANRAKAQAQRDRVEVAYEQKKSVNARRQALVSRGAVSVEGAEDAQAAEEIARSDLRVAEAEATVAGVIEEDAAAQRKIDAVVLNQHELRAPFDARVIARHKELGSITNTGEPVFTIIAPNSVWSRVYIDESLAGGLKVGQMAFVRLRSEPRTVVRAVVVRIDQESDRVTEERRVYVRCDECTDQHQLRYLGEQTEVEIVKGVIPSGRFVPSKIVEGYDGHSGTIWTVENGRLARRRVSFGERLLDGRVEVVGLPDAFAVVIETGPGLREGRAARASN